MISHFSKFNKPTAYKIDSQKDMFSKRRRIGDLGGKGRMAGEGEVGKGGEGARRRNGGASVEEVEDEIWEIFNPLSRINQSKQIRYLVFS